MSRIKANKGNSAKSVKAVNKFSLFVKHLLVRAGVMLVILAAISGVMILAVNMQESVKKDRDKEKQALSKTRNKTNSLNKQIEDLGAASQIYADLSEERLNMEFVIQPKLVRELLKPLKENYFITTLSLEFSEQEKVDLSELSSEELTATKIHAKMSLGGLSDQYIYQFIDDLKKRFPGAVEIRAVSLERRRPINIDVLSQISRGNPIETVSGSIEFDWYGFIEHKKPQSEEEKKSK